MAVLQRLVKLGHMVGELGGLEDDAARSRELIFPRDFFDDSTQQFRGGTKCLERIEAIVGTTAVMNLTGRHELNGSRRQQQILAMQSLPLHSFGYQTDVIVQMEVTFEAEFGQPRLAQYQAGYFFAAYVFDVIFHLYCCIVTQPEMLIERCATGECKQEAAARYPRRPCQNANTVTLLVSIIFTK